MEDRVQVRPSGLVQIDEGPRATQAPDPPATNRAAYPGGGGPPSGVRTRPMDQVRPSSVDTKNWARAIRAPCCEPTATISAPSLATRPSVWLMPRPVAAALNALPARVAGGKPSAAGGGAGPLGLLFAPAMTATATPNTIMATIGMMTRTPAPRKCSAERNSANQLRLTGSGRNERSSRTHSVPAPRGRGCARPGPGGLVGGVELEAGRGLVVPDGLVVPGGRGGGHRLADGRGVPEAGRPSLGKGGLGCRGLGCGGLGRGRPPGGPAALEFVAGDAVPGGEGALGSGQPGGPGLVIGGVFGRGGVGVPTVRRPPRTPCAATPRIACRVPCHLCLASRA